MVKITTLSLLMGLSITGISQNALNENKVQLSFVENFNLNPTTNNVEQIYLTRQFGPSSANVNALWWFHRWHETSIGGQDDVAFKTDCSLLDFGGGDIILRATKGPYYETWLKDANGNLLTPPHYKTRIYGGNWITTDPDLDDYIDMKYGIYEVRFKLPPSQILDASGNVVNRNEGISFAAGLYGVKSDVCHTEIDFFEMSGFQNHFTHNYLYGGGNPGDCVTSYDPLGNPTGTLPTHRGLNKIGLSDVRNTIGCSPEEYAGFFKKDDPSVPDDANGYTTMTIEVTPQRITWYMNGSTIQSTAGNVYHTNSLQNLPTLEFGFAVSVGDHHDPHNTGAYATLPNAQTIFPFEAKIDYFRYEKYSCSNGVIKDESFTGTPFPNNDISDFIYKVVSLGEGLGGTPRFVIGDNLSVRATDYIELLPGFEVAVGAELYADVHECDN